MLVDTVLHNSKIFVNRELVEGGVAIDDGKIVKICKNTNLPSASKKFNLKGQVILPGMIDCHVHLRDQKLSYKEDFCTGTAAAAAGGVTSVVDMPNNNPVTMSPSSLEERMKIAKKQILVNVAFNSAFPERLNEISAMVKTGTVGFKLYLSSLIGGININDDELLSAAFREVVANDVPVVVHAEDYEIVKKKREEMVAAGFNDADAYVKSHPPEAESKSIDRIIRLVKKTGVHVHFCHISSKLGMKSIVMAKKRGFPVTCEITPHNLLLSSDVYRRLGFFALTDPPLRTKGDVSVLWDGLKNGFIDVVASDHAPHSFEEKNVDSVWEVKAGVPGLDTTLSLLLNQVNEGRLTLSELVKLTAEEPANIFNIPGRGFLEEGNWADIVVLDMKDEHVIDSTNFLSKAKYSAFEGMKVKGKAVKTFVNGNLVMDKGEIVRENGMGMVIHG